MTDANATVPPGIQDGEAGSHRTAGQVLKDILLFFVAPFVTLVYVALFPIIGLIVLRQSRGPRETTR